MKKENKEEEHKTEEGEHPEAIEEAAEEIGETAETLEEEAAEAIEEAEVEEELPPAEEEVKPLRKKEIEEEVVEERIYTIPLGKAWIAPPNKRAPKAMRMIKDFLRKHMKLKTQGGLEEEEEEPKRLIVSNDVNERVWTKGVQKPPRKIRVRAAKDKDGNVTVYLAEGD